MPTDYDIKKNILANASDPEVKGYFTEKLLNIEHQLAMLTSDASPLERGKVLLEKANALLGLGHKSEMWAPAKQAFDLFLANEHWTEAVTACDFLYQSEQPEAIKALIHGAWLAVAFPVPAELTVTMLNHLTDEMPPNADGTAVVATTAHYVVSMRANDEEFENLNFVTTALISNAGKHHSGVQTQQALDMWMARLQLKDPEMFLPRFGLVLSRVVPVDQWWFSRDELRAKLPH